jgi:uncharacterized protein (TIGR03545 family)
MKISTEPKSKKPIGPVRTEAVVPAAVVLGLIYAYFFFFFDAHLRRGMEFVGSRVHGAEVNIADIDTSFWGASFRLAGLEVTDKEKPERNLFQVGEIRFQMLWDALLRAKFVVEDASVLDIRAYTPRRHPGFVLPPPPPDDGNGLIARVQNQVWQQTKERINENFLGDIAQVVGGVDPKEQLQSIQADLKSSQRLEQLEAELTSKRAEWEKRIKELPRPQAVKDLEAKIKALNLNTKNPAELARNLRQAKEILGEAEGLVKRVDDTQRDLSTDLNNYTNAVSNLRGFVEQDIQDLQKRLQIPSIDPKEFSTQLFLGMVSDRVASLRKYVALARRYMPPKKTEEQKAEERAEAILPRARGEGVVFNFPITKGYPLFWLKKAAVSSEINQSEWAGKVSGQILDLTTSPAELGRPLKVLLAGDFPKQRIHGFDFNATLDHTGEVARASVVASVKSFPVAELLFSDSPSVRFGLEKATAASRLEAKLADQELDIRIGGEFREPKFLLEAKSKPVQEILESVLRGIPRVTMQAGVRGSWDSFGVNIDSNLGRELSAGFQKQLQSKLAEGKARIQAFVDEKITPQRKKVEEKLAGLRTGPGEALGSRKTEMETALKGARSSASGGGVKEQGKKLFKGLGF